MPIDQTIRGLALEIDASVDPAPEAQPLLEYRFINLASTQTILARIKGIARPDGGGQLAFETNAGADITTQRMLIDDQGKVGIGTGNPEAALDVVGEARFKGPLNVEEALTASGLQVSGAAKIGGDLSVTGKLTAASFAGNGAGLRNVTPADNSVTGAKLALDAISLSKVSNETMVVKEANIGIGLPAPRSRLEVTGDWTNERGALELSGHKPTLRFTGGSDLADRSWIIHLGGNGPGDLEFYKKSPSDANWVFRMSLTENGITKINKLQLGNKWLLSGEGDAHANDDWLRLFNIQGTDYFGGFAAGKLWSIGGVVHGSDLRLKADVSSLDRMVDKLVALRGVRFKWRTGRDGDSYRIGLIAQEVERVLPEVIETGPDGMKGINEAGLVAAIITAIKDQQAELRALRTKFALLQAT
jgi:Chaperone of endosialidase